MADGDVVVVRRRAVKPIYVMGLVQHPGEVKLPPNQNLQVLDALAMAGDRTTPLADKVLVIRRVPGRKEPAVIEMSVSDAKNNGKVNLRLAPGDTVSVEDTPLTFMARRLLRPGPLLGGRGLDVLLGAETGTIRDLPERPGGCFAQMGTVPFFRPAFRMEAA